MIISSFTNQKDNNPTSIEASWDQLVDGLRDPRPCSCTLDNCARSDCAGKLGQAWCPASWSPGATRKAATVNEVCCLVIDFDKLNDIEMRTQLGLVEQYKLIVHASHSDSPEKRCLRAIVALSRPVSGKEWPRFWDAAMSELGVTKADRACRDASRIYYLPSRPGDACHDSAEGDGYVFETKDGDLLDVDYILANIPEHEDDIEYVQPSFKGAPSKEAWETAVDALSGGWPDTGRNDCQLALCGALARAGWPVELITNFVTEVCERAHPGNGDRKKRLSAATRSVSKVSEATGWPTVKEHVDPEVVDIAMTALGMGGPKHDQKFVDAFTFLKNENKVVINRDDILLTLRTAKNRLGRASDLDRQKEALYIGRALKGEAFCTHADEDQEKVTFEAIKAVTKYAPRGTPSLLLAEYLTSSRPDISVDNLCGLIEKAKAQNVEAARALVTEDEFRNDQFGNPVTTSQHNFDVALRRLNITFHFDYFARKKIIERFVDDTLYREVVTDYHIDAVMFEIEQQFDFYPSPEKFVKYCGYRAMQNGFHPVLDYLDSLAPWDGVSRTENWLIDFGGAPDTPYVRAISRIVLSAAVRRVRQPGCKFDEMLILEGEQGILKSSALRALCPNGDWFSDNFSLDGDSKKMIEQTSGKWIIEAGELRGMSAKDHNALKQYLSSTHDEARMSYARESQRQARQFIVIGTTNDTQYLRDHTGDRRYWPVNIHKFNVSGLAEIRDQLWAEALFLDKANNYPEYIRLHPSLYGAAAVEQAKRKVDNAVKIKLDDYLGELTGKIKTSDVWRLLTDDPVPQSNLTTQAAYAMQELGWTKDRFQLNGKRDNYYVKGTDAERALLLRVTGSFNFGNLAVKPLILDDKGQPVVESVLGKSN